MKLARDHNVLSIAFPVLGSGVGGFPFDEAARIMVEEIKAFTSATPEMETVVLYGLTSEHAAALQRNLL
jgi:O-acetyl-ADP-ribose deacetylase (regulator of RNase III)